jgi:hypothetical protein
MICERWPEMKVSVPEQFHVIIGSTQFGRLAAGNAIATVLRRTLCSGDLLTLSALFDLASAHADTASMRGL